MAQPFIIFGRLGNLLIVEDKFCFDANDPVHHLETVMKNDGAQSVMSGRICDIGMGGIGNITTFVLCF